MTDKTKRMIEHLYELNRIDNRLIGCLEEQLKQVTKLYKDEVKVNDVLLEKVIMAKPDPKIQNNMDKLMNRNQILETMLITKNEEIDKLQKKLIKVGNALIQSNKLKGGLYV